MHCHGGSRQEILPDDKKADTDIDENAKDASKVDSKAVKSMAQLQELLTHYKE